MVWISILIDCGETEVLIDGGNNGAGDEVVSYLTPYIDGKLDYLIATHPDADHVGGLDAVLEAFEVGEVIDSGRKSDTDTYKDYWAAVQAEGCTISYGEDRIIPLSSLAALSILETGNDWEDSNDCSVVAQLTCGNVQVLFTGDMSQQVETKLLPLFGDIDVLKVSHHGSDTASCAEFLSVVKPEYAVISYEVEAQRSADGIVYRATLVIRAKGNTDEDRYVDLLRENPDITIERIV